MLPESIREERSNRRNNTQEKCCNNRGDPPTNRRFLRRFPIGRFRAILIIIVGKKSTGADPRSHFRFRIGLLIISDHFRRLETVQRTSGHIRHRYNPGGQLDPMLRMLRIGVIRLRIFATKRTNTFQKSHNLFTYTRVTSHHSGKKTGKRNEAIKSYQLRSGNS